MEYLSPRDGRLLLTALSVLALNPHAIAAPVPIVRVMVEREHTSLRIEGFDLIVAEAETSRRLAHEDRRASIQVKCGLGGRMEVRSTGAKALRVSGPLHVTSLGGFIRVGASQYRDDLYVYSFNGDCIAVNHVDLEKYVAGLLNSEMSAKWNRAALMAQAVAARTYAIYQMRESSGVRYRGVKPPFDLDSTVRDQVYEGAHQERYKALRAVQETHGQVLTYEGKPIKAFYHSTCGGHTETPEKVWGARYPYIRSVQCDFCHKSPRFNWVYSAEASEIERRLAGERLVRGKLVSLGVAARNRLGRAEKIEIKGTQGTLMVAATRIRDALGGLSLRSTDFTVAQNAGRLVFIGHGSGHGVGMCQWGAKTMGERGRTYAQILDQYYPAAKLTKLY